jgi:hypothetical protein
MSIMMILMIRWMDEDRRWRVGGWLAEEMIKVTKRKRKQTLSKRAQLDADDDKDDCVCVWEAVREQ